MSFNPTESKSHDRELHGAGSSHSDRIRTILAAHGRLGCDAAQLGDDDDHYEAGMNSLASVNVMLALEGEFDFEFPDQMLNRSVFATVGSIAAAIKKIKGSDT